VSVFKGKKVIVLLFMEHHLTATECHLPYGITQCYLLPDTSEHTPPSPQSVRRYLIYLPRRDGRLSWPIGDLLRTEMVYRPAGCHPSKY